MVFVNRGKIPGSVHKNPDSVLLYPGIGLIEKLLVLFVLEMQMLAAIHQERIVFDFIDTSRNHAEDYRSGNANEKSVPAILNK